MVVRDSGNSDGNRARIFDPFFATNREDDRTGLGLAIVCGILGVHGVAIALQVGPGTRSALRD